MQGASDIDDTPGAVMVLTVHVDPDGPGDFLAVIKTEPGSAAPTVLRHATRDGVLAAVADWLDGVGA